MSSSCSSTDLGIDTDFDDFLSESLVADIETFVEHVQRLRRALDANAGGESPADSRRDGLDGETKCVQVHAALSMVSQAVRELLVKHPHFQTSNVFIPASQLVHSVKSINFDTPKFDASASLEAIERLESAIGNALRRCVTQRYLGRAHNCWTQEDLNPSDKWLNNYRLFNTVEPNRQYRRRLNSGERQSDTPTIKSEPPADGGALNAAESRAMSSASDAGRLSSSVSASAGLSAYEARWTTNTTASARSGGTARAPLSVTYTQPLATKQPHPANAGGAPKGRLVRRHSAYQPSAHKIAPGSADGSDASARRSDAEKAACAATQMRDILGAHENGMELAFERCKAWSKYAGQLLGFVRARLALEQEHARAAAKLSEQTRSAIAAADAGASHLPLTGLFEELMDGAGQFAARTNQTISSLNQRFVTTFENRQKEHDACRRKLKSAWTKQKKQYDSCVEELRRARQTLNMKEGGYMKARDQALRQEQQVALAVGQTPQSRARTPPPPVAPAESNGGSAQPPMPQPQAGEKRLRELEKKRKNEEDALMRKTDAEQEVCRLERELDARRSALTRLRLEIISELCDLIRQCDLTTIACSSHYFKAFSELWAPVPEEFNRLAAYAIRESSPSAEYMSFLHGQWAEQQQRQQPRLAATVGSEAGCTSIDQRSAPANCVNASPSGSGSSSNGSGLAHSTSAPSTASASVVASAASPFRYGRQPAAAFAATTSAFAGGSRPRIVAQASADTYGGASAAARRRNALHADEHYELCAETSAHQQQRRQKKSVSRLFEQSSSTSSIETASEAARSHQLQRTRQVTKCAYCEHLVIFDALKCAACGIVWHKKCLAGVAVVCGPSARRLTEEAEASAHRRMSIFGVPLGGHLAAQRRQVPLIVERCVDELQRRGMTYKGLYRTCGVKSKIEQICALFEQTEPGAPLELASVHPMNLASVIKLYLRRLPEPLMTFDLYDEWLQFNSSTGREAAISRLRDLVSRLPIPNYETLKFLILHLKRVTWFELENLMTAANLAAVISPSLIWAREPLSAQPQKEPMMRHKAQSTSSASSLGCSSASSFIKDAHQQTRAIELMVQNAYDVFLVERSTDWDEFFEQYPEVERPNVIEDAETEACIAKKAEQELRSRRSTVRGTEDDDDIEDEEDDEEEEEEDVDEDLGPNCTGSGGYVSFGQREVYRRSPSAPATRALSVALPTANGVSATQPAFPRRSDSGAALPPAGDSPRGRQLAGKGHAKQRSFTTSILVSPQADRKFAAILAARKQSSIDYDADQGSRNSSDNDNDVSSGTNRFGGAATPALLLASRKWSETARSYQRLTQYDSSDTDASASADRQQQKRTLCSGEVVVDIKKEQYCLPSNTNRASRISKSGVPLSSASFNVCTPTGMTSTSAASEKPPASMEMAVDVEDPPSDPPPPRPKSSAPSALMFATKLRSGENGVDLTLDSQAALARRLRLECAVAHKFNNNNNNGATSQPAYAFSPAGNYAYAGEDPSDDWDRADATKPKPTLYDRSAQPSDDWRHGPHRTHLSYGGDGVAVATPGSRMEVNPRLRNAVGVIFSSSDASYV